MAPGAVKLQRGGREQSACPEINEHMTRGERPCDRTGLGSTAGGGGTRFVLDQTRDTG